ncbi:uncharacterized protein LOC102699535 [Oryza brachyantha]|uniref:uncharacterized protein LOC102699535 n=1 Tax=Oryza brachyantha TaxID=4533 RepID=UPI001ADBF3C0|nr:uncharacterized protein LOC102699535 [Oryza brachyantha]
MAASSSSSNPAPEPAPLLLPAPPEPVSLPPPPEARPKPSPTVADNFRSLLRSGEALIRFAFRGNSRHPARRPPPPSAPRPLQQQHPHHHNRPAEIMKRLQREKLSDMIKLMDGHEQIERIVSLYTSGAKALHLPELPVRVKVALDAAGALLLVDGDELEEARGRLAKARSTTGLSSRFVFESSTRGGKDTVAAELATGLGAAAAAGGRPLELTRLQYCAHVGDLLSMTLVPFGAQCNNFLHGSSLIQSIQSRALSGGPPSFSERHDCGAGLSVKRSRFRASIAHLIFGSPGEHGGGGNGDHGLPNRLTTFGKVSYDTADDVKLSLSGLWQVRPPSSRFSDLGALAVPLGSLKTRKPIPPRPSTPTPPASSPPPGSPSSSMMVQGPAPPPPPTPMAGVKTTVDVQGSVAAAGAAAAPSHTVAVMVDCDMYEALRVEGWVEVETAAAPATRRRGSSRPVRWGACVSDCPERELGWGFRLGGTAEKGKHRPHFEGFLSFDLGRGGRLQPGLIIAVDDDNHKTPALVLRSSWLM